VFPVFDIQEHGYDAVVCGDCWSLRGGDPGQWACSHCGGLQFDAYPCFSYQIEREDISGLGADAPQIEDCFDGFLLAARCKACAALDTPGDYECA